MTDRGADIGACARWIVSMLRALRAGLRGYLRVLNGDAAYAHYLSHWQMVHHGAHHDSDHDACHDSGAPLTRAEFFTRETERRWAGVRRCC